MGEKDNPKFNIGDSVVIIIYGTVGVVTNIMKVEGEIVYEINHCEGLFKEHILQFVSEYQGRILEKEQIDIEYSFFFGDLVKVKGYEKDLFQVVGLRTEVWRYKEDSWEDVIYELTRIPDGEWLEAHEDELYLIADSEHANRFLKKFEMFLSSRSKLKTLPAPKSPEKIIDTLLDALNDYQLLYQTFQDNYYHERIEEIKFRLREILLKWEKQKLKRKKE
ncbi:hypothetical protein J2S13_000822 [Oikeobacillus pervagus]|uniref:Uncharacterized protein n=1 Tax=Oikeobacillus pervagus TaxID=1325931 RepID=A0AAJ1WJT9_9BACI|nr:hypothetical protein [Oikeobacillus pervagus]MDQ0214426.1 hypothetical protein [Oikeobacillus pervagus]